MTRIGNRRVALAMVAGLVVMGLVPACARASGAVGTSGTPAAYRLSAAAEMAPDFTGVDVVTGKTISLASFKGSVALLNFVNYGCSQDINNIVSAQLLAIKKLWQQRTDFLPVSVFCGCCPPEVLRQFARENGLSWPWILDTDTSIIAKYLAYVQQYGYPTLVFVDKEQYIRAVTGYSDGGSLSAELDRIINGG
ncbi:MAG: redoxin domain-containing protein [Chloroflexota bacterium]|nr:redoxin domain-containing protein [Chloroflexota bacterium]